MQINPQSAAFYSDRANARYALEDYQGAIEDYSRAIAIDSSFAEDWYNCGRSRSLLGDLQGALADLNQALQRQPNWASAYILRADVYRNLGDSQGAIKDFQKSADLYYQEGNIQYYQQIIELIEQLQSR